MLVYYSSLNQCFFHTFISCLIELKVGIRRKTFSYERVQESFAQWRGKAKYVLSIVFLGNSIGKLSLDPLFHASEFMCSRTWCNIILFFRKHYFCANDHISCASEYAKIATQDDSVLLGAKFVRLWSSEVKLEPKQEEVELQPLSAKIRDTKSNWMLTKSRRRIDASAICREHQKFHTCENDCIYQLDTKMKRRIETLCYLKSIEFPK